MFLTRIGFGSKAVVTGDTTQVDVAGGRSGLGGLERILAGIDGLGVGAPHQPRRRAPPHRAGHRRRLRAGAAGRADPLMPGEPPEGPDKPDPDDLPDGLDPEDLPPMPMTTRRRRPPAEGEVEVFGVDEQDDQPVELARWVDLATAALLDAGVRGEAELSLLFVDEAMMADLNQRFMGEDGPTDVLAFPLDDPIDAGRWPDSGSTGPDREPPEVERAARCCSATWWCARRSPPARRPSTPAATTTSSRCSSCTASCTCSAWTTPTPRKPR